MGFALAGFRRKHVKSFHVLIAGGGIDRLCFAQEPLPLSDHHFMADLVQTLMAGVAPRGV